MVAPNPDAVGPGGTNARSRQSGVGTIGSDNGEPPVGLLGPRFQNPLGQGIAGLTSSVDPGGPQYFPQPALPPEQPGGLLGILLDHLRNDPTTVDPVTSR